MGVLCNRLKFDSTAALNCRYCKKEHVLLLVLLIVLKKTQVEKSILFVMLVPKNQSKFQNTALLFVEIQILLFLLMFLQLVCLGKSMIDNKKNSVNVNPVIWIVFASFLSNVLLNILIYKKRRKNEKEDKARNTEV